MIQACLFANFSRLPNDCAPSMHFVPDVCAVDVTPEMTGQIVTINRSKRQSRFHSFTSGPSAPMTGSVFGSFTCGIVFSALAWFSGVARVTCIGGPGG